MKTNPAFRNIAVTVICYAYVLLFVYAAVSKLLDFENFRVQLGQSPLLSAFASWVSWLVISFEILISVLLIIPRYRSVALFAAFSLMVMFTAYIFIILHYSDFVPCSCGGILEKLSWTQHLVFNIVFALMAAAGVLLAGRFPENSGFGISRRCVIAVSAAAVCSVGFVALLYLASEDIIHNRNNFIRRFPMHTAEKVAQADLQFESYYIAGTADSKVYLGNYTAPLHILEYDTLLKRRKEFRIALDQSELPFKSVQVSVLPPYFYLMDGTVPCIFKGLLYDWKGYLQTIGPAYFSLAQPLDNNTIVFRAMDKKQKQNVLGLITLGSTSLSFNRGLLEKQIDGYFDSDGTLRYDLGSNKITYIYRYRNGIQVTDRKLKKVISGKTIDTVSQAEIRIATVGTGKQKFASPPVSVNNTAAVRGDLLYVNSQLPGRFESESMWKEAFVIDVYNLSTLAYLSSFYLYKTGKEPISSLWADDSHLFAIMGSQLVSYKLGGIAKPQLH